MEYDEIKYSEERDVLVMASLKAPEVEDIEKQRFKIYHQTEFLEHQLI